MKNTPTTLIKTPKTGINIVVLNSLPDDVPALVSKNPDETYTIALNAIYSTEKLQREYLHEIAHIKGNHHELPTAEVAEKLVRGQTEPTIFGLPLSEYREIARKNAIARRKKLLRTIKRMKKLYSVAEAEYYPDGAYAEMLFKGII